MTAEKQVILHIYSLMPGAATASQGQQQPPIHQSFLTRFLPAVGMGAYHTAIEVDGYHYTFAANAGIIKALSRNQGVPSHAEFKESIVLGTTDLKGEINGIVKELRQTFRGQAYHVLHRNCNHFSETFATALILYDELREQQKKDIRLETYPGWVNRLANTGKLLVGHDDDIVPCDVRKEAQSAVGIS